MVSFGLASPYQRGGHTVSAKALGTTTRLVAAWTPWPTRIIIEDPDGEYMPKLRSSKNGAALYNTRCGVDYNTRRRVVSPTVGMDICRRWNAVGSSLGFSPLQAIKGVGRVPVMICAWKTVSRGNVSCREEQCESCCHPGG